MDGFKQAVAQLVQGDSDGGFQLAQVVSRWIFLSLPKSRHNSISYADTIAPMLNDNCVSCHRRRGIGPWAMTDYNMVRGFSLMIRESSHSAHAATACGPTR